jgi:maltooligosyltrehalose trehalohydrolase
LGGYDLDAQWNDDFHHALHALLTQEQQGYYVDFGDFQHLAQAFAEGFVYSGRFSASRKRRHGNSSREIHPSKFVVYSQNHDQIGNRMKGERLCELVSLEAYKLAQAMVLLSPYIPLLFMGDEYGDIAPFMYFVDHTNAELVEAVRRGRAAEFSEFRWSSKPPDPQDVSTFRQSRLRHELCRQDKHRTIAAFHRELISLRKSLPALGYLRKETMDVRSFEQTQTLAVRRWAGNNDVLLLFSLSPTPTALDYPHEPGPWQKRLDSSDTRWLGKGSAIPNQLGGRLKLEFSGPQAVVFVRQTT